MAVHRKGGDPHDHHGRGCAYTDPGRRRESVFTSGRSQTSGSMRSWKRAGVNKMSLYRQFESKRIFWQHYLVRTDQKFWAYSDASIDKHPGDQDTSCVSFSSISRNGRRRQLSRLPVRQCGGGVSRSVTRGAQHGGRQQGAPTAALDKVGEGGGALTHHRWRSLWLC